MTPSARVRSLRAGGIVAATFAACVCSSTTLIEAHKPITSPFTFSDDVLPIVKARCASCHAPGGVAPMSLLTHADAVPWGESIRVELMAGHMPPWGVDVSAGRFRNLQHFSAREMNVLLTWASGGTPPGQTSQDPVAAFQPHWALGPPDQTIPLQAVQLDGDASERVEEFVVPAPQRPLRAVDLLPGTPAIVRRATVSVRANTDARPAGVTPERLLALWVPGDHPVALDAGMAFPVPRAAELVVRIYYRKTWQYERQAMKDQSTIGLYFAEPASDAVQVLRAFSPDTPQGAAAASGFSRMITTTVNEDVRVIAVYADPSLDGAQVNAVAVRPDGSREDLIAFRPRADWTRRFWFREPISLPRGTRVEVAARFDAGALLPPAAARPPQSERTSLSFALNVVRAK
ncbi:MAG: c-type cytochrome [Vicinamibacterales bacterium]